MDICDYDFNRICRACKCESAGMCSVFERNEVTGRNARLDEMLMACTSVQINTDDGLPELICRKCVQILNSAYEFKQQCESTDTSLREYLKGKGIKQEANTTDENDEELHNQLLDFSVMYNELQATATEVVAIKTEPDITPAVEFQEQAKSNRDFVEIVDNDKIIFTCNTCNKVFYTLEGLKRHKRVHTGEMYKCKLCNKEYTRPHHLQRHMSSHRRRKVRICKICNKTLTRVEHCKRHLITHMKNKPFQCEICKRGFNRSEHLLDHAKRCKGDKIYACEVCNTGFSRTDSLEVHKRLHDNNAVILPTIETLNKIQEYYIEVDDYSGKSESEHSAPDNLSDHDDGAHNDCFEPQVDIVESTDEVKIEPQTEDNFLQASAEKSDIENFDNDDSNDSDRFLSEYLPNRLKAKDRKGGGPRKRKLKPTREKKRQSKKEKAEEPDDVHKRGHSGKKKFNCKTCDKTFLSKSHLTEHMKFHKSKKFLCAECGQSFIRKDYLVVHLRRHRGEKPFKCKYCEKGFPRVSDLAVHERYHTGEKTHLCTICGRGFGRAYNLTVHMRTHTGEKPYQCSYCGAAFAQGNDLKVHVRLHTGERFKCDICTESFLKGYLLTQHKRSVHDIQVVSNVGRLEHVEQPISEKN